MTTDTGIRPFLRGDALAARVTASMRGPMTAVSIARVCGYELDRCLTLLRTSSHAPLARALLRRHKYEAMYLDGIIPASDPEPEPDDEPRTERPRPTADELLWEIEDAHARELLFADVADMFGILPISLRRRIKALGIVDQVEAYYPRRITAQPTGTPTNQKCTRGHVLWQSPGQRPRCRECKRASEKRRRAAA